jgi:hypothetical protein
VRCPFVACAAVSITSPEDECTTEPVQVCRLDPPRKMAPTRGSGFTEAATGMSKGLSASCMRMLGVRIETAVGPKAASGNTTHRTIAKIRIGPHDDGSAAMQAAFGAAIRVPTNSSRPKRVFDAEMQSSAACSVLQGCCNVNGFRSCVTPLAHYSTLSRKREIPNRLADGRTLNGVKPSNGEG